MAAPSKAPDRNLALELVRVTEAAAMAAGRWIGRGDKIAADQAAVDAMRTVMDTVSMAGVRRHRRGGEGRGADALQRRGDRQRPGPGGRRGRRSARGDPAHRARHAECDHDGRPRRARDDVLPRRGGLHGQDRDRPGVGGRRLDSTPHRRTTSVRSRTRKASRSARSPSSSSTGRGTSRSSRSSGRQAPR